MFEDILFGSSVLKLIYNTQFEVLFEDLQDVKFRASEF